MTFVGQEMEGGDCNFLSLSFLQIEMDISNDKERHSLWAKIFLHLELNIRTYNQINKVKTRRVLVLSKPRIFGLQFIWYTEFAESLLI